MEIKERIKLKIEKLKDEQTLEFIENWIDAVDQADDLFSKEEIHGVMEGYFQYKAGDLLSGQEAEKIFEKWAAEK